jgi:outer membrane protein
MKSAWTLPLALCLITGLTASAHAADLQSIYRDAVAYDAQYAAARATLDAGREALPQGRAGLLPSIALTANSMRNDIDINKPAITPNSINYTSRGWTVQLTQPLFRWDRWVGYTQAETRVVQAEAQFSLATQDLIVRTVQAYFDVLQANEALSAAQANRKAISEQLEEANKAFEVGTKTVVEVHDAKARYDLATAQEIVAANDVAVKRQQLRQLTGKDHDVLRGLRSGVALPRPQPDNVEQWATSAEKGYLRRACGPGPARNQPAGNLAPARRPPAQPGPGGEPWPHALSGHASSAHRLRPNGHPNPPPSVCNCRSRFVQRWRHLLGR